MSSQINCNYRSGKISLWMACENVDSVGVFRPRERHFLLLGMTPGVILLKRLVNTPCSWTVLLMYVRVRNIPCLVAVVCRQLHIVTKYNFEVIKIAFL